MWQQLKAQKHDMVKRFNCSNQTEWGGSNLRLSKFDPYTFDSFCE